MSARPLRLLFTSYRGNRHCGGQGVYLWFLTRELARLGHEITVLVGPPLPDPMTFARDVVEIPDDRFWGKWFVRDWASFRVRIAAHAPRWRLLGMNYHPTPQVDW